MVRKGRRPNGNQAWRCPKYERAKARKADRKASRIAQKKRRKARIREFVNSHKTGPCSRCGGLFPAICLDFHHRDPAQKKFELTRASSHSRADIIAEIAKCDVICANCHRLEHETPLGRTHESDGGSTPLLGAGA
jgi:hypothetical protein